MDIKQLVNNAKNLTDYELKKKLNEIIRHNYRYKNLDESNKKIILDLLKNYKKIICARVCACR